MCQTIYLDTFEFYIHVLSLENLQIAAQYTTMLGIIYNRARAITYMYHSKSTSNLRKNNHSIYLAMISNASKMKISNDLYDDKLNHGKQNHTKYVTKRAFLIYL